MQLVNNGQIKKTHMAAVHEYASDAFQDGYGAALENHPFTENPHASGTLESAWWVKGWRQGGKETGRLLSFQ